MAFFSLGMVVVSTLTFILSTMEDQVAAVEIFLPSQSSGAKIS
jgi:hypothetical protein